jgi:tRNA dimethylallyltransferase
VLAERIRARTEQMMQRGWIAEARALDGRVPADAPAWTASGYGVARLAARGEIAEAAAVERIAAETRQYAKRQRTWFRHQLPRGAVTQVNPDDPAADAIAARWWRGEEAA